MNRLRLIIWAIAPIVAIAPFSVPQSTQARIYYSRFYRQQLNPISREGFYWVNYQGGGVDDRGYYRRPVKATDAFGGNLPNGWNYAPMDWDSQGTAALYYVKDGYIIQQDYAWWHGVQ